VFYFFFSSRRRHTRSKRDWSSEVCSSDLSYCILLADAKGEIGKERMRIMQETSDGFLLSEEDLKLRGPGDFFGKKKSGLPNFKVADIVYDYCAFELARQDAVVIIDKVILDLVSAYHLLT